LVLGSAAYNNAMFPTVETLLTTIKHMGIKNHLLSIFGSYSWNGGGVKNLQKFADEIQWEVVGNSLEEKGALKPDHFGLYVELANAIADKLME